MPAYFSLMIEFNRYEIDYDSIKMLHAYLKNAGLNFKSGYMKDEGVSLDDIINHNQKLLEDNFDNTDGEGYKQVLFEYGDFTEVRGILFNNDPVEGEYAYHIIIPEDEVADFVDGGYVFKEKALDTIIELAKKMWFMPQIRTIQTGSEKSDTIVPDNDIREGKMPEMYPFAIVSERHFKAIDSPELESSHVAPGGYLIMPKNKNFK